jgi:hypothetical protein
MVSLIGWAPKSAKSKRGQSAIILAIVFWHQTNWGPNFWLPHLALKQVPSYDFCLDFGTNFLACSCLACPNFGRAHLAPNQSGPQNGVSKTCGFLSVSISLKMSKTCAFLSVSISLKM